jgi:6-phosphogluconolactonase
MTRRLYVGAHARPQRDHPEDIAFGIYGFEAERGALTGGGLTRTPQPGWIAAHPNGRVLYACNEVREFAGAPGGGVSAFAIDGETGELILLGSQATPALPCHCEVTADGRFLVVATFGGGSVHLFPLASDGAIGPEADAHRHHGSSVHPRRQSEPHAHAAALDPAGRFVLVPDLGIDQVVVYALDAERGKLTPRPERNVRLPPGSGPRHIAFSADGRFAYLMNEMSADITVFAYDGATGALEALQVLDLLPSGFAGHRSGAAIAVHPSGRFIHATTRSHGSSGEPPLRGLDSLVWAPIDSATGRLGPLGRVASGGEIPRSFAFGETGDYLFVGHQRSGTVVTFRIDPRTGAPQASGEVVRSPVPVCMSLV